MPDQQRRCEVCGWPLAKSAKEGCVPGNCSQRPAPMRARRDHLTVALNSARVMLDLPLDGDICVGIGKLLDQYDAAVRDRDAAQVRVAELGRIEEALRYGEAALERELGIAYCTFSTEDGLGRTNDKREQLERVRAAIDAARKDGSQ